MAIQDLGTSTSVRGKFDLITLTVGAAYGPVGNSIS